MSELRNSYREELEKQDQAFEELIQKTPGTVTGRHPNVDQGRILVRGGRMNGKLLGPNAAPLVQRPAPDKAPEARLLRAGDQVRALGFIYRVRKVTKKGDVVMRVVKP